MINVSQEWKENIYKGTEKKVLISAGDTVLTDDDIQGDLEIQETCTNSKDIKIGSCIASILKFNLTNKGQNVDFLNNDISIQVGIKIPSTGEFELVPLGVFSIDTIDDKDERVFKITARDRMKLFDKDCTEFLATRIYPISLWNLTVQLCDYVGIELENASIVNGDYLIDENFKAIDFTCQQLLSWIGEVAVSFININRYGKLVFKTFTPVTNNLTDRDYININVEKYTVPKITRVQVAVQEDDLGVIVGGGNITYAIINNPLLYTKSEEQIAPVANNILNSLQSIPIYRPAKLYGKGDPSIETGDIILASTVKGQEVNILVMDRKFVYRKSFRDTYESFGTPTVGEKRIVQNSLIQQKGKMNILSRTLEKNVLKVADLEIGYSEIVQTVDELSFEVSQLELEGVATFYQNETPKEPQMGDIWYNPGFNYIVDNLTMIVNDMSMTVDELIFTQSSLTRWDGTDWKLIEDTQTVKNVASLNIRADEIEAKVTSAEGNIGELQLTSTALSGRITSTEGAIGELQLTSTSLTSRITSAEGEISTVIQTADALEIKFEGITSLDETLEGGVTKISRQGIVVSTTSGNSKLEMLAADGYSLWTNTGAGLEKKFYVDSNGKIQAKSLVISGDSEFQGKINVGTDAIIGNKLILGNQTVTSPKGIYFTDNSQITSNGNTMNIFASQGMDIYTNNGNLQLGVRNNSGYKTIISGSGGVDIFTPTNLSYDINIRATKDLVLSTNHNGGTGIIYYLASGYYSPRHEFYVNNNEVLEITSSGVNFLNKIPLNLISPSVQDKANTSFGIEFRVSNNKLQYKRTNSSTWLDII